MWDADGVNLFAVAAVGVVLGAAASGVAMALVEERADTTTTDETGRTPHPDQPAEGGDPDTEQRAADGLDPENRVTGI